MATKNNVSSKLGIVITLLLVLVAVPSVVAGDWGSYMRDNDNTGRANPNFYNIFTDVTPTQASLSYGSYQPIINDFDDDGDYEVFTTSGTKAYILDYQNDAWQAAYELEMNNSVNSQFWSGYVDDNFNDTKIVAIFGNIIYTIDWNGTDLYIDGNWTTGKTTRSGVTCAKDSGVYGCVFFSDNDQLMEYNPNTYGGANYTISGLDININPQTEQKISPIYSDIDNDGLKEVIYLDEQSSNIVGVSSIERASSTIDWTSNIGIANTNIRGLLAYNFDNVGDTEVCYTATSTSGTSQEDAYIRCVNGDGTSFYSETIADDGGASAWQGEVSNPVVANVDSDSTVEFCVVSNIAGSSADGKITCYEGSSGTMVKDYETDIGTDIGVDLCGTNSCDASHLAGGRLTSSSVDSLFIEDTIFYVNTTDSEWVSTSWTPTSTSDSLVALGDVDDDGLLDIVTYDYGSGVTVLVTTSVDNEVPTLNNTYDYGGYGSSPSYLNPICVNTSVSFKASQVGGVAQGNYDNDFLTDEERLVSNCGFTSNGAITSDGTEDVSNGTYSLATPSFSCYYNSTGTYPVTLYLQDEQNDEDFTQFNTQTISLVVINGIAGVECNLAGLQAADDSLEDETAANQAIDQSVEDTFGLLTGTSTTMKLIVGFAIIIGLIISTAQIVSNPFVISLVAMMGAAMLTFIGLLPSWILVFALFSIVLAIAAKMAFGRHAGAE